MANEAERYLKKAYSERLDKMRIAAAEADYLEGLEEYYGDEYSDFLNGDDDEEVA